MTTMPSTLLTKVRVQGFWSLKHATVELGRINVLIGPNGAGKSNLLRALRLPPLMRTQALRLFSYTPSGLLVKEGKQAEFLLHDDFPWSLAQRIGVASQAIADRTQAALVNAAHKPQISQQPSWYF